MLELAPFQLNMYAANLSRWAAGAQVVLDVLPTGGGKTRVFCRHMLDHPGECVAIAHRKELVEQMSLTLGAHGVRHRILAADDTVRHIIKRHVEVLGRSFHHPNANATAASVDTIMARAGSLKAWLARQSLFVVDEGHHVIRENKWGDATELMPNAKGLLVSACPHRADYKGLGRWAAGIVDDMVVGPEMRELIELGRLADYKVYIPGSTIDRARLKRGGTGDYTLPSLIAESKRVRPTLTGKAVEHYREFIPGLRCLVFTTDIDTARAMAEEFNRAGVSALAASSTCPPGTRERLMRGLRDGSIKVGVNVDLFGEGTDVPALDAIIQARKTASLNIFKQQSGRPLRAAPGKTHGHIIDMVGNVLDPIDGHGLPDRVIPWSLDGGDSSKRAEKQADDVNLRPCANPKCALPYPRVLRDCPFCGHAPKPAARRTLEEVEGSLMLLDGDVLAQLQAAAHRAHRSPAEAMGEMTAKHAPQVGVYAAGKRQAEALAALAVLNDALAWWAGRRRAQGLDDDRIHRELYLRYKTDIFTAQTLPVGDALKLAEHLRND